jgi:hypothetical protein
MKIAASLLFLILCLYGSASQAQSRFTPDSISIEYAQCKGDTAKAKVLLINRGLLLEILDLRFADSNRTWEIYDTTGSTSFIKGVVLLPGDTLTLNLRQKRFLAAGFYSDTLVTSGAATSDTLLLNAEVLESELHSDLANNDLGIVISGQDAVYPFRIWNAGRVSHVFQYTLSPGWTFEGLALDDTLAPGDTVEVKLKKLSTSELGNFSTIVSIGGDCDALPDATVHVKIVPAHAHWTMVSLMDTLRGCPAQGEFQVAIRNDAQITTHIDSVEFIGQNGLWSIKDNADRNIDIAPGSEKALTIVGKIGATATKMVIHSSIAGNDTLPVTITSLVSIPTIRNHIDTLVLVQAPDMPILGLIDIQNSGAGSYRLTSVQLAGDSRWSILGLDTITTIGLGETLNLKLVFSGASEEGDYPVQVSIQGSECDTLLQQTLIARIRSAGVESSHASAFNVFPIPGSAALNVEASSPFSYDLIDLTGAVSLHGRSEAASTTISVADLTRGYYLLRITTSERTEEVKVLVR